MIRKFIAATVLAASLGSLAIPANAGVVIQVAPPAPRVERLPPPRAGYVWVSGHWEWRHNRHVWVKGNWVRERRGYRYVQPNWVERDGRWAMERGNWRRGDRDGDGVPDRHDRAPRDSHRH